MVIHDNFSDFVFFLYLHMAHADGKIHAQEEQVVRAKISKLFPEGTDLNQKFEAGLQQYQGVKKEDLQELIRDTFQHFESVKFSTKYKVYTDMYDIINSDGKVDERETSALEQLRQLIQAGSEQPNQ
ncbi:MAG: TerB family tellurite resistance protein [Bacteroidetes bacterium]|nr:TerB family tellurite resistance protein [Bacteroidota bacterium]